MLQELIALLEKKEKTGICLDPLDPDDLVVLHSIIAELRSAETLANTLATRIEKIEERFALSRTGDASWSPFDSGVMMALKGLKND